MIRCHLFLMPQVVLYSNQLFSLKERELKHATLSSNGREPESGCFQTTFILFSVFSPVKTTSLKIWD